MKERKKERKLVISMRREMMKSTWKSQTYVIMIREMKRMTVQVNNNNNTNIPKTPSLHRNFVIRFGDLFLCVFLHLLTVLLIHCCCCFLFFFLVSFLFRFIIAAMYSIVLDAAIVAAAVAASAAVIDICHFYCSKAK